HEERIPNDGAVIRIVSPADGATFAEGEEVTVEVEVEQFVLGQDGNHWHIHVDGESWSNIEGEDTSDVLRSLEPGEHEIEVILANGEHQDLEEGDTVTIVVEEG
ncbi:MAG: DUF6130 family protein, partial [Chloroflexi bacterium]|nr:DUF6130 family protein [Chloroflexota bacterium]